MSNTAPARKGSSLRTPRPKAAPVIKTAAAAAPRPAPPPRPGATPVTTPAAIVPNPLILPDDSPGVKERIDRALASQRAAEAQAAEVPTLRQQLAESQRRYTTDMLMVTQATRMPSLASDEVRDFVRERYDATEGRKGTDAASFSDWFKAQQATPSPLLAPFLRVEAVAPVAAPVTPPAPVAGAPALVVAAPVVATPGDPNNGTVPVPVQQGKIFTDAEVNAMDGATWSANSAAIREQLANGVGGIKVRLPGPRKKTA